MDDRSDDKEASDDEATGPERGKSNDPLTGGGQEAPHHGWRSGSS